MPPAARTRVAEVHGSTRARADLAALDDDLAQFSPAAARARVLRLLHLVARLANFPRSGRVAPELADAAFPEIVLPPYRIVHLVDGDPRVEILTVFHSSRPLGSPPDADPEP